MSIRGSAFYASVGFMDKGQIRAAWPVAANPVRAAAGTANWLLGRGVPLVVDGGYVLGQSSGLQTFTFRYKYRLDDIHHVVGIYIVLSSEEPTMILTLNGSPVIIGHQASVIHYGSPNLVGNAEAEAVLVFIWTGATGRSLLLHNVLFYESPAIMIEESGAGGIEPGSLVYDGYTDRESIAGLERAVEDLRATYFRRGALFNWNHGRFNVTSSSTTYADLFPELRPAIQTRLMYNGETTRNVRVGVYALVSGGTGNVRVTMLSGGTVTFNITTTTGAWAQQDIAVETDDPARWSIDGGIRGGTRDTIRVEYRAGAGQTLSMLAVSVWDAPGG
jgi:hypothetical protein